MLFINKEIAGVHLVGTLKEFRNKGIGTEITKKAFEYALSKGAKTGVLQASPMGKNMYKKIGFQEYSRISHWEYNIVK
jgi:predicted GNAT family acetyltransferase